jgi:hypothetical protein
MCHSVLPTICVTGKTPEGHSFRVSFVTLSSSSCLLIMRIRSCCGLSTATSRCHSAPMMCAQFLFVFAAACTLYMPYQRLVLLFPIVLTELLRAGYSRQDDCARRYVCHAVDNKRRSFRLHQVRFVACCLVSPPAPAPRASNRCAQRSVRGVWCCCQPCNQNSQLKQAARSMSSRPGVGRRTPL